LDFKEAPLLRAERVRMVVGDGARVIDQRIAHDSSAKCNAAGRTSPEAPATPSSPRTWMRPGGRIAAQWIISLPSLAAHWG